jgi:hypothetical protein
MTAAQPQPISQHAIESALERDDPVELMDLILEVAVDGADREFAENCCVRLARHRNPSVRGNAVLGFGHLARRFGQLDGQRVKRLVEIALQERSDYVRAQARSAAEDLATFLSWEFEPPDA